MMTSLALIIAAFAVGAIAASAFFLWRQSRLQAENAELKAQIKSDEEFSARFSGVAQEALKSNNELFLQLAAEKLKSAQADGAHDLDKRSKAIDDLVKPVQEKLEGLSKAIEQVKGTDQSLREEIQNLNRETTKLVGALRDPRAQGTWGEFILERLLENSSLIKGVHYETQVSMTTSDGSRQQPDAVIKMQDGFHIIIDSKAPLNEFARDLSQETSAEEQERLMQNLARQVREHVKKLGRKDYWENIESPDFTVLFLPSEHLYSIALRADPELVEFASANNIVIASPTLLMSLLRVVGMSWRQVELAKNAAEISERGTELYKRFLKFTEHFEKVGKGLQTAMGGYNAAVGSLERQVLPAARKMRELQGENADTVKALEIRDETPREIMLTADDEQEKKRA